MTMTRVRTVNRMLLLISALATMWPNALDAMGQTGAQGNNAVWSSTSVLTGSGAFVDVAAFCGAGGTNNCNGLDFCTMLNGALTGSGVLTTGGVVDARGVVAQLTTMKTPPLLCASNPFASISGTNAEPVTVLLPASTIDLQTSWILPSNIRLVGEGGPRFWKTIAPGPTQDHILAVSVRPT